MFVQIFYLFCFVDFFFVDYMQVYEQRFFIKQKQNAQQNVTLRFFFLIGSRGIGLLYRLYGHRF